MKNFILTIFIFIITASTCSAIPNPESWKEVAKASKIKSIATVTQVKVNQKAYNLNYNTVTFKTLDNKIYTGTCASHRKTLFRPKEFIVGPIVMNPKKNDLVYVTISKDGGQITTYQKIKKSEIEIFERNPDKIEYGLGTAKVKN